MMARFHSRKFLTFLCSPRTFRKKMFFLIKLRIFGKMDAIIPENQEFIISKKLIQNKINLFLSKKTLFIFTLRLSRNSAEWLPYAKLPRHLWSVEFERRHRVLFFPAMYSSV